MSEAGTSKHIKCKDLSLADKILVIDELEKKTSQSTVAKKFGISQSQVSQIFKSKEKLFSAHHSNKNPIRKRARKSTQEDVEDALLQWFKQAKSRGLIITGPMLREKAKNIGKIMNLNFDSSSSWVTRWRERNLIVFKCKHGEKQDHYSESAKNWIVSVWLKIHERYSATENYNCDETGLYFHALPEGTLCFKNDKLSGSKKSKERLTVLLTTNMDGSDTLWPFVIGKLANPCCFRGIKKLSVTYKSNKNSWMTATLFQEWLKWFNDRLRKQRKKVCLLLDNCTAHKIANNGLQFIKLVFLPPNTTSYIQPLDQGIIKNFKHDYFHHMLQKIVLTIDAGEKCTATDMVRSISVLDVVNFMSAAWNDVSADTIQNCFFRSRTPATLDESFLGFTADEVPPSFTEETYTQYVNLDDGLEVTGVQDDADICAEVLHNKQVETDDVNEESPVNATALTPPKNKEVLHALVAIRRRLQFKGEDIDIFLRLEKQMQDSMRNNIKQSTIVQYFTLNEYMFKP